MSKPSVPLPKWLPRLASLEVSTVSEIFKKKKKKIKIFDCSGYTVDFTEKCWNNLIVDKFSQEEKKLFLM